MPGHLLSLLLLEHAFCDSSPVQPWPARWTIVRLPRVPPPRKGQGARSRGGREPAAFLFSAESNADDVAPSGLQDVAVVERVINADRVLIDARSTLLDDSACGGTSRVPAELDQGPDEIGRVSRRVLLKVVGQLAAPEPAVEVLFCSGRCASAVQALDKAPRQRCLGVAGPRRQGTVDLLGG